MLVVPLSPEGPDLIWSGFSHRHMNNRCRLADPTLFTKTSSATADTPLRQT